MTHQLREAARDVQRRIEGKLRIGIIPTIANNLLPIIVKPLVEKYPLLKMEIAEMTTDHILAGLKDGMIDVGILSTPLPQAADYEEEVLYYEQLLVYGDTAAQKQFIMPDEIIQEKIWLLEEGHCLREQFINLCSLNRKETAGNFHFEANSFETLLNMVDSFGGLTLLPELYVRSMPLERRAHVLSFAPPYPVREVSLLYFRPFAKHRLINMLSNELKTLVPPLLSAAALKASEQVIAQI
ncbi:MAG: LysR substrate-binding domain-containing protein [Saprospiraceae bacterium]